jgi:hypothetical protein
MVFDLSRDKRNSTDRTEWRFDPVNVGKTIRTESLSAFFQEFFTAGTLQREKKLEKG